MFTMMKSTKRLKDLHGMKFLHREEAKDKVQRVVRDSFLHECNLTLIRELHLFKDSDQAWNGRTTWYCPELGGGCGDLSYWKMLIRDRTVRNRRHGKKNEVPQ